MIQFVHGNSVEALQARRRGAMSPRFAGCGDTTGVVNEESDQKRTIPLVEWKRGGSEGRLEQESRGLGRSGAGRKVCDDSRDNLPIILRERASRSNGPRSGLRIGWRLAAADGFVTAAIGRLGRSNSFREERGLREDERQNKQRRQYDPGNFHAGRYLNGRLVQPYHSKKLCQMGLKTVWATIRV
jgi:hypothetical protein